MDDFVADRVWDYCGGIPLGRMAVDDVFCDQLHGADHRCAAAERQGGGFGGGVWRSGEPDGVWAARGGIDFVTGDDVVRGDVHGLRDGIGAESGPWSGAEREFDFSAEFKAGG